MHKPTSRVVAELMGSLPMGGIVVDTPVHAFVEPPPGLVLQSPSPLVPVRRDLPMGGQLAFVLDNVVTAEEADQIVMASELLGYRPEAPGIATPPGMRINKTVHWVAPEALMEVLFARIGHLLPTELGGKPLHAGFSHRVNIYRYDAQDVFNRHTDGDWPGYGLNTDGTHMVEWSGLRSGLTMLLYLNAGPQSLDSLRYCPSYPSATAINHADAPRRGWGLSGAASPPLPGTRQS
jgi:hypothetical protein